MDKHVVFAHERLVAYQRAVEFSACATTLVDALGWDETHLADQLRRASDSIVLNVCEGAGRTRGPDQARFYDVARGSATECAGILALLAIRDLAPVEALDRARRILHQVVCLLTALARSVRTA